MQLVDVGEAVSECLQSTGSGVSWDATSQQDQQQELVISSWQTDGSVSWAVVRWQLGTQKQKQLTT